MLHFSPNGNYLEEVQTDISQSERQRTTKTDIYWRPKKEFKYSGIKSKIKLFFLPRPFYYIWLKFLHVDFKAK